MPGSKSTRTTSPPSGGSGRASSDRCAGTAVACLFGSCRERSDWLTIHGSLIFAKPVFNRAEMVLRSCAKYLLGIAFVLAGVNHFWHTDLYARIMPPYLPWPHFLVLLSGVCESGLGALLLVPRFTRNAAWGLIALLAAVFPANLHMALHPDAFAEISPVLLWMRLPMQGLLIWWVSLYTRNGRPSETTFRS